MAITVDRIGKLLVGAKLISEQQLKEAIAIQRQKGSGQLGSTLVKMGLIEEEKLLDFLAQQYRVPSINLKTHQAIDPSIIKLVPVELVKKHMVVPLKRVGSTLTVAMADPTNVFGLDDLKFRTNYSIQPVIASESALLEAIHRYYGIGQAQAVHDDAQAAENSKLLEIKDYTINDLDSANEVGVHDEGATLNVEDFDKTVGDVLDSVEVAEDAPEQGGYATGVVEAPIVKLVNGILVNALKTGSSDIHIEPYETVFRVRYRLDGNMMTVMNLPLKVKNAMVSRIKIMAKLDIAERRLPQDGRIKLKLGAKRDVDFRVSVMPTLFGEKAVLRVLDKANVQLDMTKLGLEEQQRIALKAALAAPFGMILVTGPTGSGKTTTLYSALQALNTPAVNICTAEDPVEFNFMGINQVQVHGDIGFTFSAALKAFLRQDPDIIMIGEIRDYETGEIGVKSALTGHLVLASLHTNDAPSTINRLLNMGIEPFLVASSVVLIIAQRLARRICKDCKVVDAEVTPEVLRKAGMNEDEIATAKPHKGLGCAVCNKTGYKGRVALYQVLTISDRIRTGILQGASTDEIKKLSIEDGVKTLRMSGLTKIAEGITTISEVESCTVAD
ncbi:MAG TPA: type IV-A pilus assembly ATPase PilB [Nitrospirales bacterium]|jgi:type IV pilus assembly protein PilB